MTHEAVAAFEESRPYPLDPFQRTACEFLARGSSVLVAAPTGSGKTTVAEFAIAYARRERDAHVIYTTPIKALSNQKYRELCDEYGEDQVGLLTGDMNRNADAPIVVMTTEVLRNMIYDESPRLECLSFVILDEVHFLGDRHRGAVWEEIILHLPPHIRIVGLSATVSNVEDLGHWMHAVRDQTEVVISERRPVPLYQHVLTSNALLPLFVNTHGRLATRGRVNPELRTLPSQTPRQRSRGQAPRRKRTARVRRSEIAHALHETRLLPAIVFIFSRVGCDQAVQQVLIDGVTLTTQEERREIRRVAHDALRNLSESERRVLKTRAWVQALERGVAAHHAGLLPLFKRVVEELFQRRLVKLVFATETLALGINMPAKAVVIEQLEKFNGEDRVPLTSGEYTQLTGRAGRRGIDEEGHAIVVWNDRIDLDTLTGLAGTRSYPVRSSFQPTFNMAVNLLERMAPEQVRETLERSFAQFQADRAVVDLAEEVRSIESSLAGYERARSAATSAPERREWDARIQKLRKRSTRLRRRIGRQSGGIARQFDRVTEVLVRLGYVTGESENRHKGVEGAGDLRPNRWGALLQRVYGTRDLLVAECVRAGLWDELDPPGLAALICSLAYEPRRSDDGVRGTIPDASFQHAYQDTVRQWSELDRIMEAAALPRTELPQPGMSHAVYMWAHGSELTDVLRLNAVDVGEFIRWTKQTIDLLDQVRSACLQVSDELDRVDPATSTRLSALGQTARQAAVLLRRDIVETSDQ